MIETLPKDIFGMNDRHHGRHWDYILLYNILHDMKIYANVEIDDSELNIVTTIWTMPLRAGRRCKTYFR